MDETPKGIWWAHDNCADCTIDKTDGFKIHIPRRVQRAFDLDKYQKEKKNV
jgi:hypothetical protein